ncbi:MAG: UDP-N-acetylglucosamine 2-epimerase (hydrolyzing) [Balneolaceae bacterium]|nr:UDP-N-acetylglucosamine 2-epimerase (hydrolyzing) [Balneolaceae bacterium]MCH8550197.1 UDP-N-acetylglucosamine 2-epimerase [Balneolaceae bacterium]
MIKKIGFFTGARSEYGIMKNLLRAVEADSRFDYKLYVSGLHLLKQFGETIHEIKKDGFSISSAIEAFREDMEPGEHEFTQIITQLSKELKKESPDALFVIGDRPETYAAVLAAHFSDVDVIHLGGGTITEGALDNIYRYNITNLSSLHFATSQGNYKRLKSLPVLNNESVFFTGSFAVDAIKSFLNNPVSIFNTLPKLKGSPFCLMTFHSATKSAEDIHELMDQSIKLITERGFNVLITYPNNDPGYKKIMNVIDSWKNHDHVFVQDHLGALNYYAALNDCTFVVGNSSSGIIEAPYFNKPVIDVGTRQKGREKDTGVISIPCNEPALVETLSVQFDRGWPTVLGNQIYGTGNSLKTIMNIFNERITK